MSLRVVSKSSWGFKATPAETIVDIARPSVLGNLHTMRGEHQRRRVIDLFEATLRADWKANGPMRQAIEAIANDVEAGRSIALQCWCAPRPCHGDVIKRAIEGVIKKRAKCVAPVDGAHSLER